METTTILPFTHRKEFINDSGKIITMKAIRTIHGRQFVECYENDRWYEPDKLTEVIQPPSA